MIGDRVEITIFVDKEKDRLIIMQNYSFKLDSSSGITFFNAKYKKITNFCSCEHTNFFTINPHCINKGKLVDMTKKYLNLIVVDSFVDSFVDSDSVVIIRDMQYEKCAQNYLKSEDIRYQITRTGDIKYAHPKMKQIHKDGIIFYVFWKG